MDTFRSHAVFRRGRQELAQLFQTIRNISDAASAGTSHSADAPRHNSMHSSIADTLDASFVSERSDVRMDTIFGAARAEVSRITGDMRRSAIVDGMEPISSSTPVCCEVLLA